MLTPTQDGWKWLPRGWGGHLRLKTGVGLSKPRRSCVYSLLPGNTKCKSWSTPLGISPILCLREKNHQPLNRSETMTCQLGAEPLEDTMRKILVFMLLAVFVGMGLATGTAVAQEKKEEKKEKKAAVTKEVRWRGTLMIIDKTGSALTVRSKDGVDKIIHFDSSTQWTKKATTIDPSEFKVKAHVLCLGKYDEKGAFHATRIDLRYAP